MYLLTNRQKDICAYCGTAGALIAATSLVQMLVYGRENWLAFALMAVYLFSVISFITLAIEKPFANILLVINAVLVTLALLLFIVTITFSLISVITCFISLVTPVVVYVEKIPERLRQKARADAAEKALWNDKL